MNFLRKHAQIINITQRILDIFILLFITWLVSKNYGSNELNKVFAIYGSLLMVVIFSLLGIYKSWRETSIINQIKVLFFAWLFVLVVFNCIIFLLSNKEQLEILLPFGLFNAPEFIYWSGFVLTGLCIERIIVKILLHYFREKGYNQRRAVIAGAGEIGIKLAEYINENSWMGIQFIGFFDDHLQENHIVKSSPNLYKKIIGTIEQCCDFTLQKQIDMVFIALPMSAEKQIDRLIWSLGTKGIAVYILPDLFTMGVQKSKIHYLGDLPLMDFNLFPAWKRIFDIIFSLFIIVLTFPVWLLIIALIKLEDGGPVFYKHSRVMENGKKFFCLKFRTMHVDADQRLKVLLEQNPNLCKEWETCYKLKNDPRITKVGKLLRRSSIDELPQFLNVIAGDMSVVGARPVVSEELEKYYKKTALTYCSMKPGITGLWQVGKRSDTSDYDERVEIDRSYVVKCSIWLDLKIISKTIWRIIRPRGAY